MTNTTHISSLAGSQANRQGDTGVICFCQRHRNSLPTPPGVDKAGVHSLAGCALVVITCLCRGRAFSEDLWKNVAVCQVPWLAPWLVPGSAQRAKVSRPARGFPPALAWAVIITAYSRAPTLRARIPLRTVIQQYSLQCVVGVRSDIGFTYGLNTV